MSDKAKSLSNDEWKCLEAIGGAAGFESPGERAGVAGGATCSEATLRRLELKGLVERVPEIWLPLEMKRSVYRLTAAGRALLVPDSEK